MNKNTEYNQDFYAWALHNAKLLQQGKWEEVESMGRSEKRQLVNKLAILIMHLLKWQFQLERRSTSWRLIIKDQRFKLIDILKTSPSLKNEKDEIADAYKRAVVKAAKETGLLENIFPEQCPYSWEQCLNEQFLP